MTTTDPAIARAAGVPGLHSGPSPARPSIVIDAQHRTGHRLSDLWPHRELLFFLVWRDLKVRYKQTVLGVLWAVVQPIATMLVFTVFFGRLIRVPSDGVPYSLFAFVALVPWTYFSAALSQGSNSLVASESLISKVYFPRLLIPLAAITTPLVDAAIGMVVLAMLLGWFGHVPSAAIGLLPLFALLAIVTAFGVCLLLSALNVQYRDVRYVLPFLVQLWMFATPVAYPASVLPEAYRWIYAFNPMVVVVEGFRWSILGTTVLSGSMVLSGVSAAVAVLLFGAWYFRRLEGTFADSI